MILFHWDQHESSRTLKKVETHFLLMEEVVSILIFILRIHTKIKKFITK